MSSLYTISGPPQFWIGPRRRRQVNGGPVHSQNPVMTSNIETPEDTTETRCKLTRTPFLFFPDRWKPLKLGQPIRYFWLLRSVRMLCITCVRMGIISGLLVRSAEVRWGCTTWRKNYNKDVAVRWIRVKNLSFLKFKTFRSRSASGRSTHRCVLGRTCFGRADVRRKRRRLFCRSVLRRLRRRRQARKPPVAIARSRRNDRDGPADYGNGCRARRPGRPNTKEERDRDDNGYTKRRSSRSTSDGHLARTYTRARAFFLFGVVRLYESERARAYVCVRVCTMSPDRQITRPRSVRRVKNRQHESHAEFS